EHRLAALGDVGLDAAAGDRAVEATGRGDRELRAERARRAAPGGDDGRERDLFARRAPFLRLREHLVHTARMLAVDPLDDLLARVDAGELGDPLPVLAYVAGQAVELPEKDRTAAPRRALPLFARAATCSASSEWTTAR